MNFENQIQQWVSIDNQLKILNDKTRELRDKRNTLEHNIIKYADENNLSNSTIEISDGKLKFTKTRSTAPLTLKYLETTLGEFIRNETHVIQIMEYLKKKRNFKIVNEIKRFTTK
jgi:hypothetical protein